MYFSFPRSHLSAGNTANPDCIMIVGRQREGRADSCSLAWSGDWRERTGLDWTGGLNAEISLSAVLTAD